MEGKVKQVKEEGKLTEVIKKGKKFLHMQIVDIFNENETTPLSQL
jgi:hypothetical protein